jgi:hypothetical protein
MKDQVHPILRDAPIGIAAAGQRHETDSIGGIDGARSDEIVDPRKMVGRGVAGS